MKTKISHLGRSTVSVILAVMMLLSTMLIGTVSTVNAATIPLEEGTVVYVQVKGGGADWYADTNNAFSAWVWGGQATNQWVQLKSVPSTDNKYFYFVVPKGGITSCILHRKSNTMEDGWTKNTNFWNATGDITLSNTNNLITIKGWDNNSSNDSCYQIDSTAKLDADSASVKEGTAVTFTPSLTSNTDFNDIKSVSYSVIKDSVDALSSDCSIDDNKITFNKAGNYEVTANVIYNAKGFSDITKTATATTTVTVESSLTPVAQSVSLTASPETVKVGNQVTLTAVATNPASSANLTYTFTKTSSGDATVVQDNNKLTVTPTAAGTYQYTVTVSADGYSPVTSNEVSFTVTAPVQYYLAGRINQDRTDGWVESINDKYKFTESDTEGLYYYESKNTPKQWSEKVGSKNLEQYFYIIDSSSNKYGSKDNQTDNTPKVLNSTDDKSTLEKISSTDNTKTLTYISNQENISNVTFWLDTRNGNMQLYYTSATAHSVKFGSNSTSMGSVTAKNGSSNISSGDSVAENSSVTFTATANKGYRFDGWYSDADCTNPIVGASNATYTVNNISQAVYAYAKFSAVSYNITTEPVTNYSVVVKESAEYNSTVAVTVTVTDNAYELNGITVTDEDNNVVNVNGGESGVYTFTMPASDVTVKANSKLKQIGAPTVRFNVLGQSTAAAKVLGSTVITASYTAAENSTIVEDSENVVVTDSDGATVSADKYSLVKNTATGNYTFTANEPGTYKLSYTVTAKSNYNESMTATNSPVSVTINVSYTDTQNAYLALSEYVDEVKDTTSDGYTEDSYAAFFAALTSAKGLLKGLPNADASDADKYTTALNDLTNAHNNLKSNKQYYILGHPAITGRTDNTSDEKSHNKGILMKDNGNGDYTYTFSSLNIGKNNDAFCFIDNNDKTYKTDSGASIDITDSKYTAESPYIVDILSANQGLYYIGNNYAKSKRYTIHLNTATNGKIKVWVEEAPLAYGLQGAVYASQSDSNPIGWSNYSEAMSFNAENNYTLKFYAKDSNPTNNQFRLIDSAKTDYGSNIKSGLKVNLNTYYTTTKSNGYTYHVDYSNKPYTIKLNPGKTPPEFVVTQGTQYSVTVAPNIENGKISVDKPNPYEGDTVTVTATPDSDYVLDTVTFNNTPAKVVGNTATFTMPNENVTVTATFRTANKYTVTIASDITNGTVKANGNSKAITVTEGTSVTLVATPASSYSFSSWSITPENGYTAEGSMTSATATIYPTANITVSASFAQGTASADHFLAWGDKGQENIADWTHGVKTYSSTDGNGNTVYTADLDKSFFEQNAWYCFAVTNKIPSSDTRLTGSDLWYNYENITVNGFKGYHEGDNVKTERKNNGSNYFGMFQYSGEVESLSISYNEGTKNYQVTPVVKVHNGAKLYAKDGAYRTKDFSDGMNKGKTSISYDTEKYEIDVDTTSSSLWQIAYLSEDNIKDEVKLTITTKVTDSKYYLAGWCVDGETYLPKTSNTESNEYSFDYYVKSTTKLTDTIEVTPVYFYQASAAVETVRFYVTGFDDTVKKDWGNTIAIYPYYSGTGGNVFSKYPGQPMLMSGGRYYVDLPITYNGGTIAGVTLNNFYYDAVHMGLVSSLGNRQTYDYNDFLKIYEQKISGSTERKSQEIIFSFKYVPSGDSGYNNFGDASTGKGTKAYPQTISAEDMETVYKNGWEDLTDFYGNKVDLYDQKVDASSDAGKKNPWRVISNGYEQTYFGYYATRWAVYKPDVETGNVTSYSLVDVISSSSLLYNNYEDILKDKKTYDAGDTSLTASSDAEAYKAFKDNGAVGVPVKITYEQTIKRGKSIENGPSDRTENAFRNDGRWYYSKDYLDVTAHTVIEYADTLDGFSGTLGTDFRRDYYQDGNVDYTKDGYDSSQYTGQTTGTSAYFTNDEYYKKTEAKGQTGSGKTFDIIANTDHASQYIFVGWYLLSEGKYSPLTSTVENSVSVPQDNNDVYVARFIKAPSGSLTISHKLHPKTTGLGKCYVSVDVLNSTGEVIHSYDETTSDITVSNAYITYGQGNKIKITLKTVPGEATTFTDFYSYSSNFAKLVNTETGVVPAVTVTKDATNNTYKAEISFNVDDYLFDKDSAHQQNIKVLNYYSLLSLGSVKYEIKYTFNTRLYGTKVYKVSGTLTADDITNYGCTENQLSESFVMAKAPFESNFRQNITWDSNEIKFGSKADGTLTAAITATQVEDKNVTATFRVDSESEAETITTNFGNRFLKDGSYISAKDTGITADVEGLPEAYRNKNGDFSFWYVMTMNKEFVTKAYGQNFAYTGYDNYIVVAVYGVDGTHKDELTDSSINFLQYSRNHWNDTVTGKNDTGSYSLAGTEYDRLYADFNLMFNHNGLLLNNYSGNDIKVGYAMVVGSKTDGNYTVDQEELKTAILSKATDGGTVEHQSESATASKAVKVTGSDNDVAKKNVIVNSIRIADLDNKNRITSYYGFKNSEANQSYYVQVYSYVIADNQVTLSKTPVVINLNDIGNKTYVPQQ